MSYIQSNSVNHWLLTYFRKKKLTSHWRDFIRPIMWRCKWAELKMKELQLQAAKYNREISAHDRRRYRELNQASLEELGSKSLPFIHPRHRKRTMKRRKRKRVEDGTDITTHMSTHNLFSYFGTTSFSFFWMVTDVSGYHDKFHFGVCDILQKVKGWIWMGHHLEMILVLQVCVTVHVFSSIFTTFSTASLKF